MSFHPSHLFQFPYSARSLFTLATLLAYVLSSFGLPLGGRQVKSVAGCQCRIDIQKAGQCCCTQRTASSGDSATGSCCAFPRKVANPSKPAPSAQCCSHSQEKHATVRIKPVALDSSNASLVSSCSCQDEPLDGFLCNSDPRLLNDVPHALGNRAATPRAELREEFLPDRSLAPETPPPKLQMI